ncbi:MAG: helix-turn-helix domain-containing protein [Rhodospirillales bacterium]|nr:helix-turn-helix domain-containing protein [Rhodospirillales bacterium]
MGNDGNGFFDTKCAAAYLGLSPRTLDGYRVNGDGPAFHRFGNRVRYHRPDLDAWAARRRATTTAEADRLGAA